MIELLGWIAAGLAGIGTYVAVYLVMTSRLDKRNREEFAEGRARFQAATKRAHENFSRDIGSFEDELSTVH